jgi:hypothetical protein
VFFREERGALIAAAGNVVRPVRHLDHRIFSVRSPAGTGLAPLLPNVR